MIPAGKGYGLLSKNAKHSFDSAKSFLQVSLTSDAQRPRESSCSRSQGNSPRPFGFERRPLPKLPLPPSGFAYIMKSSERANAVVRFVFRQTIPNIVVTLSRWYELQVSSVYEVRMPAFGTRAKTVECFHNNHDRAF
jgi:hypothetical protein